MTEEVTSPLTTSFTDTISELFLRDPMTWTEQDLDRAILELREQRKNFLTKPAKVEKAPKIDKATVNAMSTDDLLSRLGL
jgi:hypothetical protein